MLVTIYSWSMIVHVSHDILLEYDRACYFLRRKSRGYGRRVRRSCDPQELELPALYTHSVLFEIRVGVAGFCRTRFFYFIEELARNDWAIQSSLSRVIETCIGLRGVFRYCVTQAWCSLGLVQCQGTLCSTYLGKEKCTSTFFLRSTHQNLP